MKFLAYLMKKYKLIQGFGQGKKYCSDPDVLLCFPSMRVARTLIRIGGCPG